MRSTRRAASSVLFTWLVLAGCFPTSLGSSGATTSGSPAAGPAGAGAQGGSSGRVIVVGAGPQMTYTLQQPAAGTWPLPVSQG